MTLVIDVSCKGSSSGQRILLEDGDTLNVGRANESLDLVADPRLSRKHFILRYNNREIEITHLSRTNPTLVASEGSADFIEITGSQIESSGCRIIAGSHRFVAVVEAEDSIIEPTLSGEDQAEIWSDVDSDNKASPFFESFPEPDVDEVIPDVAPAQATIPSPGGNKPVKPSSKPAFSMDDSNPDTPEDSSAADTAKPEPLPTSKSAASKKVTQQDPPDEPDKKIFFPIEDDFFD